jgi:TRAP-type C4-dicarboxylate transport system permease small subunit
MLKQKIIKIDNIILLIEKKIVIFSIILMLFLSSTQIFLRIFFHSGIIWADTFLRHLVMISALFSSSIVSYYSSHFKIEILEKLGINKEIKKYFDIIAKIINSLAVLVVFIAAINFVRVEFDFKNLQLEIQTINILLPIIFLNMLFHTITCFFKKDTQC